MLLLRAFAAEASGEANYWLSVLEGVRARCVISWGDVH